jgi:hypothetical protein
MRGGLFPHPAARVRPLSCRSISVKPSPLPNVAKDGIKFLQVIRPIWQPWQHNILRCQEQARRACNSLSPPTRQMPILVARSIGPRIYIFITASSPFSLPSATNTLFHPRPIPTVDYSGATTVPGGSYTQ